MSSILKGGKILPHKRILLEEQRSICPLCKSHVEFSDAVLDHCHSTGNVRAVLHDRCNRALGFIEWAISNTASGQDFLTNVGSYLEFHSANPSKIIHGRHARLQKIKVERECRLPRVELTSEEKLKYKQALLVGPLPHPNPKKNTSVLGSWKRTSNQFEINHGRLLAYVNGDRLLAELD